MRQLVVVGNGMAGVRAVEEILARGGGDEFAITVFGDEPYGNYNRILLSNVLAGSDDPDEIYLNGLDWYTDNGIDLRAEVRVVRLDTFAHRVLADDGTAMRYDKVDTRNRLSVVLSPDEGIVGRRQDTRRWRIRLPHPRGHGGDDRRGPPTAPGPSPSAADCWGWKPPVACKAEGWPSTSSMRRQH